MVKQIRTTFNYKEFQLKVINRTEAKLLKAVKEPLNKIAHFWEGNSNFASMIDVKFNDVIPFLKFIVYDWFLAQKIIVYERVQGFT